MWNFLISSLLSKCRTGLYVREAGQEYRMAHSRCDVGGRWSTIPGADLFGTEQDYVRRPGKGKGGHRPKDLSTSWIDWRAWRLAGPHGHARVHGGNLQHGRGSVEGPTEAPAQCLVNGCVRGQSDSAGV